MEIANLQPPAIMNVVRYYAGLGFSKVSMFPLGNRVLICQYCNIINYFSPVINLFDYYRILLGICRGLVLYILYYVLDLYYWACVLNLCTIYDSR